MPLEKIKKDGYPTIAKRALNRDDWEGLHRAVSMRVPNDKVFSKLMKSVWIFAGDTNNTGSDQDSKISAKEAVNDMEAPVPTDEKVWEEFFHEADGVSKPYWFCAETGETVWQMPNIVKENMIMDAKVEL